MHSVPHRIVGGLAAGTLGGMLLCCEPNHHRGIVKQHVRRI
jgi:hypothetical protein